MGEFLRHSTELARTIFLMMVSRKLVTPRAFGVEYTRRSWCILHVMWLNRLNHAVLVRIHTSDQIRSTCRDRGRGTQRVVRENNPLSCVVTRAPFSMPQFGLFHPMLDFRDVSKGEVRQYATATAPIFYPQPTVLEGTQDVIGNFQSHAARRVAAISQTQGNGKASFVSLDLGLVGIGRCREVKRSENLGTQCLMRYKPATGASIRKSIWKFKVFETAFLNKVIFRLRCPRSKRNWS